ncbi:hypothetical protein VULLAG_LOCUS18914 [Vulpes lagopus]
MASGTGHTRGTKTGGRGGRHTDADADGSGLYASGPHPDRAALPLRRGPGLGAFANTALRTAAGLRRNRAWPWGSSPPLGADWRRAAVRLLIGRRRSHSGRPWWVRLPQSDKLGFRHASAPAASRSSMEVAASTGWWLQQRLL